MKIWLLAAPAAAVALTGCVTAGAERAPVCDGRQRRPANLYGSVLATSAPAAEIEAGLAAIPTDDPRDEAQTPPRSAPDQSPPPPASASC